MAEIVVGFHDEIYAENCSLRHRSEENRKRCIALESKMEHLKEQLALAKQEKKAVQSKCDEELADAEVRLAGAIDTIEALKEDSRRDKQQNLRLLLECNAKEEQLRELRYVIDQVHAHYMKMSADLEKANQDVERLKEVNTRLVQELRRLNQ